MGLTIFSLFEAILLIVNSMAILNEKRFLTKRINLNIKIIYISHHFQMMIMRME